jgi:hypothetical protein
MLYGDVHRGHGDLWRHSWNIGLEIYVDEATTRILRQIFHKFRPKFATSQGSTMDVETTDLTNYDTKDLTH